MSSHCLKNGFPKVYETSHSVKTLYPGPIDTKITSKQSIFSRNIILTQKYRQNTPHYHTWVQGRIWMPTLPTLPTVKFEKSGFAYRKIGICLP